MSNTLSQEFIDMLLDRALERARLREIYTAQAVLGLIALKAQWEAQRTHAK